MLKDKELRERLSQMKISSKAIELLLAVERNSFTGEHPPSLIESLESPRSDAFRSEHKFGIVKNVKKLTFSQKVWNYVDRVQIRFRSLFASTPQSRAQNRLEKCISLEAMKLNQQPYWIAEMEAAIAENRQLRDEQGRKVSDPEVWRNWNRVEWEAQLQRVAKRLERQYGSVTFYAERAAKDRDYWRNLASSSVFA